MLEGIIQNPWQVIASLVLLVAIYFFQKYNSRIENTVDKFIDRVNGMLASNELKQKETRDELIAHKDSMGKATKAINGDMLRIEKSVFSLKQDLSNELQNIKNETSRITREFDTLSNNLKLSVEGFNDRYGALIEFKKKIETNLGKIILVEENTGKNRVLISQNKKDLAQFKEIVTNFKKELNEIKRGSN